MTLRTAVVEVRLRAMPWALKNVRNLLCTIIYLVVCIRYDVTEVLVVRAGPWDHNVWYGIYVCPRWLSSPKIPCRAHRRRSLPPESCSCTSGIFSSVPCFSLLLIQHVPAVNGHYFGCAYQQYVSLRGSCADRMFCLCSSCTMQISSVAYHTDFFSAPRYSPLPQDLCIKVKSTFASCCS